MIVTAAVEMFAISRLGLQPIKLKNSVSEIDFDWESFNVMKS